MGELYRMEGVVKSRRGPALPHVGNNKKMLSRLTCDRSCRLRCSLREKARLQYWHLYFFSAGVDFLTPLALEGSEAVAMSVCAMRELVAEWQQAHRCEQRYETSYHAQAYRSILRWSKEVRGSLIMPQKGEDVSGVVSTAGAAGRFWAKVDWIGARCRCSAVPYVDLALVRRLVT